MLNRTLLAAAVMLTCSSMAGAQVLVNDTWIDGTRTDPAAPTYSEFGVDSDLDGDLESAWYRGGAGTLVPTGPGGPLRASGYGTSSATWTTYFTPEATPVNLAAAGDTLTVTWKFIPRTVNATNNSQNFRVALVDSPAAARISSEASPGSAAYTGYGLFGNMGQTFGHNNSFQLVERNVASGALLSGSGDWVGLANGATNGNTGYANDTEYTFVMTLTRTLASELDIAMTMSGGNINGTGNMAVNFTDVSPNGFAYDTFSIRPTNEATTAAMFDTTLFRVEFSEIPEPSSLAVLGLAGLTAFARRRRKA